MRKEPIVFIAVAAFVAWQYSGMRAKGGPNRSRVRSTDKEYVSPDVPDVELALADTSRGVDFERDLFSPPSPTQPLPPLPVELPPLEPLGALTPPAGWGPLAADFGRLLRRPSRPSNARDLPGLFEIEELPPDDEIDVGVETADALEDLDDPDARAARIAALKKQYDWLFTNEYKFGRIQNPERYTPLFLNPPGGRAPDIVFVEVDPATGVPKFGGTPLVYGEEKRVEEYGLVDNPVTFVEVGHASFPEPIPGSRFDEALRFATVCLTLRNETPRALEVAEDLYRRAQAVNTQDSVGPRLGLARCYELGFDLEAAYDTYRTLLDSGHATNAAVHARLGELLSTLRMDEEAEKHFEEALRVERTSWVARWHYGRFLRRVGRADEAVAQLREAVLREPKGAEDRPWRVRVRLENGAALLAAGQVDEAFDAFAVAKSADVANEVGLGDVVDAGMLAAARLSTRDDAREFLDAWEADLQSIGSFDLLLSSGLVAMDAGRFEEAAERLRLAAQADPFRAGEALRASSRLAEITGNPEDATAFADDALAADPIDPWTLVHRGRLSELAGDPAEARAAYRAALDLELDLVPALERMGALLQSEGDHEAAERYFDRAVSIEPDSAKLRARRGWNALSLGDLELAEANLREARRLDLTLASARAGLAWWHYASGDSAEALTLFGEIVDDRRAAGADDPILRFAEAQAERIREHESKEVFIDRFDRASGRIGNDWKIDQGFGPLADLVDGAVVIEGTQVRSGRTRVFRSLPPDRFLAFSCEVTVGASAKGTRAGVFLSSERTSPGGEPQINSEIVLSRSRDGDLQVRVLKNLNETDANPVNVPGPDWIVGDTVRLTIERTGDDLESRFTLYVDGEPVAAELEADRLTASRQPVNFGVFVEGEASRVADLVFDNARVVRRK